MVVHCDDDDLTIIALGEPASATDEAHLQGCPRCRSRLDQLAAVVATSRAVRDEDTPVAPPAAVWDAISEELGLESDATVTSLDSRRRRRRSVGWMVAAASVAGVLVGSLATVVVTDSPSTSPALVASAGLDPLDGATVSGTAVVEEDSSGTVLRVSLPELPDVPDGYYEVWMATSDASTMVAIGTLDPRGETVLRLPSGMPVGDFPLVDVSVEHFDGDAGHSAQSLVRGLLQA